jgi:NitT/TauT family transport system ATP-binding protein
MSAGAMSADHSYKVELNNVSHSYGETAVIKNLDLKVKAGEFVVLVGPSGCGKTTLLNLISGHIPASSGSVKKEGITRTIYQSDGLFPWLTVAENIGMGLRSIPNKEKQEKELNELFSLIHLNEFRDHYPHELSGGMRQRVELARVLAGDSDILLMDEPFSALDYQTRMRMRHELIRLLGKRQRTVIFVTHDIEEAALLADRILVLSNRPSMIRKELLIDASKPRALTHSSVIKIMEDVLNELGLKPSTDPDISDFDDLSTIKNT